MAVSVAKGNAGVCTTDANRISVSKSWTATAAGSTAAQADSAVKSVTKDLRLAYPAVECNITGV
jgi:hypothetical protein